MLRLLEASLSGGHLKRAAIVAAEGQGERPEAWLADGHALEHRAAVSDVEKFAGRALTYCNRQGVGEANRTDARESALLARCGVRLAAMFFLVS